MPAFDPIDIENEVALVDAGTASTHSFQMMWNDLSAGAAVGNPFYTPAFLLPLLQELKLDHVQVAYLSGPDGQLRALAPISTGRLYRFGPRVTKIWVHNFIPLGTPLIRPDDETALHDLVCGLIERTKAPVLGSDFVGRDALSSGVQPNQLKTSAISTHQRAALRTDLNGEAYRRQTLSKQRRQGMERRFRKLEQKTHHLGPLAIDLADTAETVPSAFEDFMRLEKLGWKGGNQTALMNEADHARFARQAALNLAKESACLVATLKAGDTVLAALTTMRANQALYSWKTAFDESYAECSPGAQLLARFADNLMDSEKGIQLDSCSSPDNAIANSLWGERILVEEVLFHKPEQALTAHAIKRLKVLYRQTKGAAQNILRKK